MPQQPRTGKATWLPPLAAGGAVVLVGLVVLIVWRNVGAGLAIEPRVPVTYARSAGADDMPSVHEGERIAGAGEPAAVEAAWPQFRGPGRDNVLTDGAELDRDWPAGGPAVRWAVPLGEGYAGAAIAAGRVYVIDYDMERLADVLRCLSLDDGREIWRYAYPLKVKRNHGMSRTVPAVADGYVVSIGPKSHVLCCDAATGEKRWLIDMVGEFGSTVPPWYAGQCPLIDRGRVILAPAGSDALLIAVDLPTGEVLWRTPNPMGWRASHTSVMPMTLADGRRTFVYVADGGVAGVDAETGELLWHTDAWRISVATVPSALPIDGERIFLAGGYNAGAMMLTIDATDAGYEATPLWSVGARTFGSAQHTPVLHDDHIFGVRPDKQLACLDTDGNVVWTSGPAATFGLGPYLIADGALLLLDDHGTLTMAEATAAGYRPIASARVLDGHDAWGPMALAAGRLIVRDLTEMRCIDLRPPDAE